MQANIKYITDENGDRTAVVISIHDWQLLKLELEEAQKFQQMKNSLESGLSQAHSMNSGHTPKKSFDHFLEELK